MADKKKYDYLFKLLIDGEPGVGKTRILLRFTDDPYTVHFNLTAGINFKETEREMDGYKVKLQIWVREGEVRYKTVWPSYCRGASGIMLVYDITSEHSFKAVEDLIRIITAFSAFDGDVKLILVGNNCEHEDYRQVPRDRGKQLADMNGMLFFEISGKTGTNVETAFISLVRAIKSDMDRRKRVEEAEQPPKAETENLVKRLLRPFFGRQEKSTTVPEEIQQDPYARELYERALLEGKEHDRSVRVNIVGNYRQGKTSLLRRLLCQSIAGVESTNGIDFQKYECFRNRKGKLIYEKANAFNQNNIIKRLVRIALEPDNDTSHTSNPSKVEKQQSMSGDGKYSVISKSQSPIKCQTFEQSFKLTCAAQKTTNAFQINTPEVNCHENSRAKQRKSVLSKEQRMQFEKVVRSKVSKTEINEKVQTSFAFWDFGGQFIFYATHTIFHSKKAIYLLVFDLSLPLTQTVTDEDFPSEQEPKTMAYYIQFWINSIYAFVGAEDGSEPVVLLVGTHKDKLKGDSDTKVRVIEQYFKDIRDLLVQKNVLNHIYPKDFAVSNAHSKDEGICELRETIMQIGNDMASTIEIPAKWIQLEKSLSEINGYGVTTIDMVQAIDSRNEFPLNDVEQIKLFLLYHHAKGNYIYFDQSQISNYVILEPQFLIDAFKNVISSERFCTHDPVIRPLWKKLLSEARLEQDLVDCQWNKDTSGIFMKNKSILLAFLTKHHIISEAALFDEQTMSSTGLGWYIVPSLLRTVDQNDVGRFLQGRQQTSLRLVLEIQSSTVVSLIFHRLMAALIGKWCVVDFDKNMMIFCNAVIVRLAIDHVAVTKLVDSTVEMIVASLCPSVPIRCDLVDFFRRFSECILQQEFLKHRDQEGHSTKPYKVKFRCNNSMHLRDNHLKFVSENHSGIVPCPDLFAHEIKLDSAISQWYEDSSLNNFDADIAASDKILSILAQSIGNNWELLAFELGISQAELEQIKDDNRTTQMKIYYMLLKWRSKADVSSLKTIVEAIKKTPALTVEWDRIKNLNDRFE